MVEVANRDDGAEKALSDEIGEGNRDVAKGKKRKKKFEYC